MNEQYFWESVVDHLVALVLREEEMMGKLAFSFVIVVDWDIHENAAVKAEKSNLFWFSKDICPHNFSRAVHGFKVAVNNFVVYEEVPAFDVISAFGTGEQAINL
jgi:hypothetical protein